MGLGASAAGRWGCPTHHTGWCAGRRDNRARGPRGRGGADALQCGQGANHRTQHTSMLTRYSHTSLTSWPSTFCRRWFAHCVCQTASGTQQAGDRHAASTGRGMDTDGEQQKAREGAGPSDAPLGQPGTQRGPSRLQAPRWSSPARFPGFSLALNAGLSAARDKRERHGQKINFGPGNRPLYGRTE